VVKFEDRGYSFSHQAQFLYIDRWSNFETWGGIRPPVEGETVSIPTGFSILLDVTPPKLGLLVIEGTLIFDDNDIELHCDYIMIRNGHL